MPDDIVAMDVVLEYEVPFVGACDRVERTFTGDEAMKDLFYWIEKESYGTGYRCAQIIVRWKKKREVWRYTCR